MTVWCDRLGAGVECPGHIEPRARIPALSTSHVRVVTAVIGLNMMVGRGVKNWIDVHIWFYFVHILSDFVDILSDFVHILSDLVRDDEGGQCASEEREVSQDRRLVTCAIWGLGLRGVGYRV